MNKILLNKIRNVRHYSIILNTMPGASYVGDIAILLDLLISKMQIYLYVNILGQFVQQMTRLGKDFTFSVDYLQKLNLDKNNPRDQKYDNATKMHGKL